MASPSSVEPKRFQVFVGWDHAVPVHVQDAVVQVLATHPSVASVQSFGPRDTSIRVDYPDVAVEVCNCVLNGPTAAASSGGDSPATPPQPGSGSPDPATSGLKRIGVLMCGTGIGMSIAANKIPGIRAAVCHDHYTALMCRKHNDANVLCAGARVTGPEVIHEMLVAYLETEFELTGRHSARVAKISALETHHGSATAAEQVAKCCVTPSPNKTAQ